MGDSCLGIGGGYLCFGDLPWLPLHLSVYYPPTLSYFLSSLFLNPLLLDLQLSILTLLEKENGDKNKEQPNAIVISSLAPMESGGIASEHQSL